MQQALGRLTENNAISHDNVDNRFENLKINGWIPTKWSYRPKQKLNA